MFVACYTVYSIIYEVLRTLTPSFSCICEVSLADLIHFCLCTAARIKLLPMSISREHSTVNSKHCDSFCTEVLGQMSQLQGSALYTAPT